MTDLSSMQVLRQTERLHPNSVTHTNSTPVKRLRGRYLCLIAGISFISK